MFSGGKKEGKKERACSTLKILFRPEPQDGSRGVLPASPVVGEGETSAVVYDSQSAESLHLSPH